MLDKLEHGHVHIAAFGRVSVGKSSLLNALLGKQRFRTSPLHGETKRSELTAWESYNDGGVYLIDTPGINEIEGKDREKMAHDVASRVDLVLFIVDGDITDTESAALRTLANQQRPILLILNKSDRYSQHDIDRLLKSLEKQTRSIIEPQNIILCAAQPAAQKVITINEQNEEVETIRQLSADVTKLRHRLWDIIEKEGKTLAALNASLFADNLNEQVTRSIITTRKTLAEKVVRTYCISKGVAVALNPLPVADLVAAVIIDAAMILHLSRVYNLPITRREAQSLVQVIAAQMLALMGTVWVVNLISSALKASTGGLSTAITGGAQGAVAYYSTYVVGQVAERYLAQGKAWGDGGPKQVVREILDNLNKESILRQARGDILSHLKANPKT